MKRMIKRNVRDDVNLIDLFDAFRRRKIIVSIALLMSVIFAFFYNYIYNKNVTANIEIRPLSVSDFAFYDGINDIVDELLFESDKMLEMNYNIVRSFDVLKTIIIKHQLNGVSKKISDAELDNHIVQYVDDYFDFNYDYNASGNPYFIRFKHHDPDQLKVIVDDLLKLATDLQKENYLLSIDDIVNNHLSLNDLSIERLGLQIESLRMKYKKQQNDQIEVLNNEILGLKNVYKRDKLDRLKLLGEQILIAKELGIDNPNEYSELSKDGARFTVNQYSENEEPLYMRGYLALEAEVSNLQRRNDEDDESFVPGLRLLESQLFQLKNRKNEDAYISEIRNLEKEINLLKNDPTPGKIKKNIDVKIRNNDSIRFVSDDVIILSLNKFSVLKILFSFFTVTLGLCVVFLVVDMFFYEEQM